jgi:RNA polymerase sigma-70 factor (TIGR02957 family)
MPVPYARVVTSAPEQTREFEAQRGRLFAVAYRLLGSASEAEDAVQDTFLRWSAADPTAIETPAAWLTKVLTNLCLNRLSSARARRENYVGHWLPEPVITADSTLGPLDTAEQRDSVSMAFLLLLERLTPPERAVFVLREAFEYGHREIAEILDLTEANCQQLYRRARLRVAEERPRFHASHEEGRRIAERFLAAARGSDLAGLEGLLAADVVSWADGGGKVSAARHPIHGAKRVARYLAGWIHRDVPGLKILVTEVNAQPAVVGLVDGQALATVVLEVSEGRVSTVRTVVNPEKLTFLTTQVL